MCCLEMLCQVTRGLTPPCPISPTQSVENAVCVLRNLSYRLYDEMPPSSLQRLEGHRRNNSSTVTGELVGCFSPQSKKAREVSGGGGGGTVSRGWGGSGMRLAEAVMLGGGGCGRRWTPASAQGWDARMSSAEGDSGVRCESGC